MGNMKIFWIFGFERWGDLRPAVCWMNDGRNFIPVIFGIWIRWPFYDL